MLKGDKQHNACTNQIKLFSYASVNTAGKQEKNSKVISSDTMNPQEISQVGCALKWKV